MNYLLKKVATPIITILLFSSYFFLPDPLGKDLSHFVKADDIGTEEKVFYYLHDHLGGIEAVTDEDGNVVERRDYLPYGEERLSNSESDENYGYTGKEQDDETGLYYYGARYYDPQIGRFTQIDPLILGESEKPFADVLSNPQALNSYSYVLNNPVRYVDENGKYGSDFHYVLQYYLGLKAGLDDSLASEIAFFDDRTDTDPNTNPHNPANITNGNTVKFHFQSRSNAVTNIQQAINANDSRSFGQALHTYQDTYSHDNINGLQHLIYSGIEIIAEFFGTKSGTDPDKTSNNVKKAMDAAHSSFLFTRDFKLKQLNLTNEKDIDKFTQESDTIWGEIKGPVEQYLNLDIKDISDVSDEIKKKTDN